MTPAWGQVGCYWVGNIYTCGCIGVRCSDRGCPQITEPSDGDNFDLTMSNNTATQVAFTATSQQQISWELNLAYQTSGGRGPFRDARSFTTTSDQQRNEQYTGMGGQLTVRASSQDCPDQQINLAITGTAIPDDDITARLEQLYNDGATPRLMTGIAAEESTYRQFTNRRLYNVNALWPVESYDGGSHIGLMQVPVNIERAWNWMTNTTDGVAHFREKLRIAQNVETRIRRSHTDLRALDGTERENMALVLYGPHGSRDLARQYYVPQCQGGVVQGPDCRVGVWQWVENTAGNRRGVDYAQRVRSRMR